MILSLIWLFFISILKHVLYVVINLITTGTFVVFGELCFNIYLWLYPMYLSILISQIIYGVIWSKFILLLLVKGGKKSPAVFHQILRWFWGLDEEFDIRLHNRWWGMPTMSSDRVVRVNGRQEPRHESGEIWVVYLQRLTDTRGAIDGWSTRYRGSVELWRVLRCFEGHRHVKKHAGHSTCTSK